MRRQFSVQSGGTAFTVHRERTKCSQCRADAWKRRFAGRSTGTTSDPLALPLNTARPDPSPLRTFRTPCRSNRFPQILTNAWSVQSPSGLETSSAARLPGVARDTPGGSRKRRFASGLLRAKSREACSWSIAGNRVPEAFVSKTGTPQVFAAGSRPCGALWEHRTELQAIPLKSQHLLFVTLSPGTGLRWHQVLLLR